MWLALTLPLFLSLIVTHHALLGSEEADENEDPPCTLINPLCTCSSPGPIDLGRVTCAHVPFNNLPNLNGSRIFMLRLENNGLTTLTTSGNGGESAIGNTGLWKLSVNYNLITKVSANAFKGLERSLRELDFSHNQLHYFPGSAIQNLQRLQKLNLNSNNLVQIVKDDLTNMENSLEDLNLGNNQLVHLSTDLFSSLHRLKSLDLSGNRLSFGLDETFRSGPAQLTQLDLSNNQLTSIPLQIMASLESLKAIDLSNNIIKSTSDLDDPGMFPSTHRGAIRIERLILDSNRIDKLLSNAFRFFARVGKLSLNSNPLITIGDGAFWSTELEELSLKSCDITQLSPGAFRGVENSLRSVDLSYNSLDAEMVGKILYNLTALQRIVLTGTNIGLLPAETFLHSRKSIQHLLLDASGKWENTGGALKLSELHKLQNLRTLAMAQFPTISLSGFEFRGQSSTTETLSLRGSNLRALEFDAFRFVAGLRILDLSSNHLDSVNPNAFYTIGHSLETLDMSGAFVSEMDYLPNKLFHPLVTVRYLTLANNCLKYLNGELFVKNYNLKKLNLRDNCVEDLPKEVFNGDKLTSLRVIDLSFNRLSRIVAWTFVSIDRLTEIMLNDNRITTISKTAFVNLYQLEHVNLRGNRLTTIDNEAMQNIPRLRLLDLAYNHLQHLDLEQLEQLGGMATLQVNMSHNYLRQLRGAINSQISINTKVLDLSKNRVDSVDDNYLKPIETSLMQLYLNHNQIQNITKKLLGQMNHLQILHLDNNRLINIEQEAFSHTTHLQILALNHNQLAKLYPMLFSHCQLLRRLDLSKNRLKELSDLIFLGVNVLEHLNLASNYFSVFPTAALKLVATTLTSLDLSDNHISHIAPNAIQQLRQLLTLDLSSNVLHQINAEVLFHPHSHLKVLRISNNQIHDIRRIHSPTLERFHCKDVNLNSLPIFDTPNLLHLDVSRNRLVDLNPDAFQNATQIRWLDISDNRLKTIPSQVGSLLSKLVNLNIAYNPLNSYSNNSLSNFRLLNSLQMHDVTSKVVFNHLKNLRMLSVSYHSSHDTVLTVSEFGNLQVLALHVKHSTTFELKPVSGINLPSKLHTLNLIGVKFTYFAKNALQAFVGRNLTLRLRHTSFTKIPNIFNQHIRYLVLDLSDNNLFSVEDMVTSEQPGAQGLFLLDLVMQDNLWKCDSCENVGWIGDWMKLVRQRVCQTDETTKHCVQMINNMREVKCKQNKPILNFFYVDIECFWKSVGVHFTATPFIIVSTFICVIRFGLDLLNNC